MSVRPLAIIPTYLTEKRDLQLTFLAISTLKKTAADCDLLVVDDGSPDRALLDELHKASEEFSFEVEARPSNEGFARAVNVGLRRALDSDQDAVLINADIQFIDDGWLDRMLANPADVVGAFLLYRNGLIQHAGVYYSVVYRHFDHIFRFAPGSLKAALVPRICPVTAALQLIRNKTLQEVGIYDEDFRMGYEDMDFCHRVFEAGGECRFEPSARAIHLESMFRGKADNAKLQRWQEESWEHLHEKWAGHSFGAYTPTLLLDDD